MWEREVETTNSASCRVAWCVIVTLRSLSKEKRPPTPQQTLAAPVALLAFRGRATAHNISLLAVGARQHLGNHGTPKQSWSLSSSNRGYQINRSETSSGMVPWFPKKAALL